VIVEVGKFYFTSIWIVLDIPDSSKYCTIHITFQVLTFVTFQSSSRKNTFSITSVPTHHLYSSRHCWLFIK